MASSLCKIQPPKARKRIIVGLPVKQGTVNGSSGTSSEAIPVMSTEGIIDAHDTTEESTCQASSVLAKSAIIPARADTAATINSTETDSKPTRKRKSAVAAVDIMSSKSVKPKKEKDPNEPKRPPTSFFLFMEEFRRNHKKANPNAKGGAALSKEGGDKWKSMSDEAKEPFVKKCNDMKEEYQKALQIYKANGKESIESTITDNAEEKCDVDIESNCEETAASVDHNIELEQ